MKRILWFSRHKPMLEQARDLGENVFHETVEIIQKHKEIKNGLEVKEIMEEINADEVVVVLPINLISQLIAHGIRPYRAVMERVVGDKNKFRHKYFERIDEVYMEKTLFKAGY